MLKFYYFFILFTFFIFSYAQDHDSKVAEYRRLILEAKHDTTRIRLNTELAIHYTRNNDSSAIKHEREALKIAQAYGDDKIIAEQFIKLTEKFLRFGKYSDAIRTMHNATHFNDKLRDDHFQAMVYIRRAWTSDAINERDSAFYYAGKAIKSNLKGKNDRTIEADAYIIMASVEVFRENEPKSIEYYLKALDISESVNYRDGISLSLVNLASRFLESGDLNKAEYYTREYSNKSKGSPASEAYANYLISRVFFEKKEFDSTLVYSKKALDAYKNLNRTVFLSELYSQLGVSYKTLGKYSEAISMFKKVIKNDQTTNNFLVLQAYINLSESYVFNDAIDKAKASLDSVHTYLKNDHYDIDFSKSIYYLNYLIFEKEKDYEKAHFYFKKYEEIADSIQNAESKLKLSELETIYQVEKREQKIASLNAVNKIKNLQLYLLIGASIIGSLLLFIVYNRFLNQKKIRKQLEETDKIKTRFFTNISHEFRTPLTLIQGSLQNELEQATENKNLNVAYKNVNRLKELTDQLLDLSKVEAGNIELQVEETNLSQFFKIVYSFFTNEAEINQINYKLILNFTDLLGYVDKDKLEKIIVNLLSNAFKFTPKGGDIRLQVHQKSDDLYISVSDTGIGISEGDIKKIFNRFYQSNNEISLTKTGSGIGLALANELTRLHRGNLSVESEEGKGSNFKIAIPISKSAYNKSNELNLKMSEEKTGSYVDIQRNDSKSIIDTSQSIDFDFPLLMIVEDNVDMRHFLIDLLKDNYKVIETGNGNDGYTLAEEYVPDLIISDYMMPEMDGITFCKKIKENIVTSHIPFIMLTAKAEEENKLRGLESGVDFYLTKPFNKKELLLTVQNQIALVKKYKDRLINRDDNKNIVQTKEQEFITKIYALLESNFTNENFGVHELSENLYLSRMQTYRKVKALTGESPLEIIKAFRLKKAKEFLKESTMDIGQISLASGFKNHSNFTKVFKEAFHCTPLEYAEKFKSNSSI